MKSGDSAICARRGDKSAREGFLRRGGQASGKEIDKKMDIHTLHILTDEQLVKMAQEGSETAEEILIEKYKSLVKNKAKTYYIAGADNEDVVQEGMIGIFKAIRSYDANKEAAFKTYADTCINNQILSAIKKANRRKHQPLNESIPLTVERVDSEWGETNTEEAGFVKGTMESNPEAVALLREIAEVLQAQNSGLFSNFERQVWAERLKGYAYTEIAAHLGKSPKSIDNAMQRIRKKVLTYMEK